MVNADGQLSSAAFPTEELLAVKGKTGASVDRCGLLEDPKRLLCQKVEEGANPAVGRNPWGYCTGEVGKIRSIGIAGNGSRQALKICPDPVVGNSNPKPWDQAHALILKFDNAYTRSQIRGVRDQLIEAFSCKVRTHATD
ncbi:MAG: hypothetical protein OXE94_07980 [Aestuariivita sp.]|nr:hypothetical protein [Aestuariivita sp.]MCY4204031.1 hypothetical protein [Aestuariivita sp.]